MSTKTKEQKRPAPPRVELDLNELRAELVAHPNWKSGTIHIASGWRKFFDDNKKEIGEVTVDPSAGIHVDFNGLSVSIHPRDLFDFVVRRYYDQFTLADHADKK